MMKEGKKRERERDKKAFLYSFWVFACLKAHSVRTPIIRSKEKKNSQEDTKRTVGRMLVANSHDVHSVDDLSFSLVRFPVPGVKKQHERTSHWSNLSHSGLIHLMIHNVRLRFVIWNYVPKHTKTEGEGGKKHKETQRNSKSVYTNKTRS